MQDFFHKYTSKNKATSKIKFQQILSSWSLSDVGNYLMDGPSKADIRIIRLHQSKGTTWVLYIYQNILIHMGVHHQTNYLCLLYSEMGIVFEQNTKSKVLDIKQMVTVQRVVHIYSI